MIPILQIIRVNYMRLCKYTFSIHELHGQLISICILWKSIRFQHQISRKAGANYHIKHKFKVTEPTVIDFQTNYIRIKGNKYMGRA